MVLTSPAPPGPVTLLPEALGSELGAVLREVELMFECDCSNVLVVVVKWSTHHPRTVCTVDMEEKVRDLHTLTYNS